MSESRTTACSIYYCNLSANKTNLHTEIRGHYHQMQHQAGRNLLRYGLKEQFGLNEEEYDIFQIKNEKPYLANHTDIHFNISHCDGLVVCAIANDPVGIDAEPSNRLIHSSMYTRALHPKERLRQSHSLDPNIFFLRYWTLKESYLKLIGMGLACDLTGLSFHPCEPFDTDVPPAFYRLEGSDAYFMQWDLEHHIVSYASHVHTIPRLVHVPDAYAQNYKK